MEERTIVDPGFPPAPAGDATRVMNAPIAPAYAPPGGYGDATQQSITVTCPVCRTPNPPAERYCQDCGLLFGSTPDEVEPLPDASQLPRLVEGDSGRELALNPGLNSVGRESADILVAHPTVSRRHAQVTLEAGMLIVEDLGSTNGTYVGAAQVRPGERVSAYNGDVVRFGSVQLTLTVPGGGGRSEAPAAAAVAAAPVELAADRGAALATLVLADGTEYPLYSGANSLGRRSGNQIVLADAFASGKHGEVRCNPDGTAEYVDLGSTNGSFLLGERLAPNAPVPLVDGTVITLGKTAATFRVAAPPADDSIIGEPTRFFDASEEVAGDAAKEVEEQ